MRSRLEKSEYDHEIPQSHTAEQPTKLERILSMALEIKDQTQNPTIEWSNNEPTTTELPP